MFIRKNLQVTKGTKNFAKHEFTCPCCGLVTTLHYVVVKLQMIRDYINLPIRITSGTRCKLQNEAVGGSSSSDHIYGYGVDIAVNNARLRYLILKKAFKIDFDRVSVYKNHVHLGVSALGNKNDSKVMW